VTWIEPFLATQDYDEVVFLGDYFDSFNQTDEMVYKTSEWFKKSLSKGNRIHLWGNHDIAYRYWYPHMICSGNSERSKSIITTIITPREFDRMKLVYITQNFVLSHAGVSKYHFLHPILGITHESIQKECNKAMDNLRGGIKHPVFSVGHSRGGWVTVGGILWQDFNVEFKGIRGINQIVGHSFNKNVKSSYIPNKKDATSENYDIDCWCKWIGILENGKFSKIQNPYFTEIGEQF